MIDIDFQSEEVRETVGKLANETGKSLETIINEIKYFNAHKTFVRFTKGVAKGKVGYYFPSGEIMPYSRDVYCPDDSVVVTMGWDNSFEIISEEEYLKECEESADDRH
jgi:hypothetical protein